MTALPTVMESDELPDPFTEAGVSFVVTPVGIPVTVNCTVLANPLRLVTVMVAAPLLPRLIWIDPGAEMEKSPVGGFTTSVTEALWVGPPALVPVTVMV